MRLEDAPPPGWYPDPQGGARLRYWEGTDWSDRFRARPIQPHIQDAIDTPLNKDGGSHRWVPDDRGLNNPGVDTQAVVDQVRMAARQEAERASQMFGAQARSAAQSVQPLISQYTTKISRWFRRLAVLAVVLALGWLIFQVIAQQSLFNWIGDRIDNVVDEINQDDGPVQGLSGVDGAVLPPG